MIEVSALPPLAFKVGPNLFDLSTQMHAVSMRDQMHRGTVLAEALVGGNQVRRADRLRKGDQVLIVGAGVAGVSAGIVLARHGVKIQIIDTEIEPFSLQRNVVKRFVGPYMYEWPLSVFGSQEIPPASGSALDPWNDFHKPALIFDQSDPSTPDSLVRQWDSDLYDVLKDFSLNLRLQTGVDRAATNPQVKLWLRAQRRAFRVGKTHLKQSISVATGNPWRSSRSPEAGFAPRFVILAAGMGAEQNKIASPPGPPVSLGARFWANDALLDDRCGKAAKPKVVILGGGDGALQDTLRALTQHPHPLDSLYELLKAPKVMAAITAKFGEITVLEAQHAQLSVWASSFARTERAVEVLDKAYEQLAKALAGDVSVRRAVLDLLRTDVESVVLCIRGAHFSKAYGLNRFLVHLIEQSVSCAGANEIPLGAVQLVVRRHVTCNRTTAGNAPWELDLSDGNRLTADVVAVRFGSDAVQSPWQWLGLNKKDTRSRQDLAAIPLPLYMPPSR